MLRRTRGAIEPSTTTHGGLIGRRRRRFRAEFAASYQAARERRPQSVPRLNKLIDLYARGQDVDPLVGMEDDQTLSSGDKALIVLDGRHRIFAAADVGVDDLPVFVLRSADAVFSY